MTTIIDYLSNLESMRENLATSKLRTGSMPYPAWMQISSLKRTYTEAQELLRTGKLHYAYLVQANTALFRSGSYDCPGNIVIGYSDYFDSFPKEFREDRSQSLRVQGQERRARRHQADHGRHHQ